MGLQIVSPTVQLPTLPTQGYVHWSSFLYQKTLTANDRALLSTHGWEVFECPSLLNGGIPPANTFAANSDGLPNEAGTGVLDLQAPRMSYMLNEALTPRSVFVVGFRNGNLRYYHFVKAGRVKDPSETVLATEMWGNQGAMRAASNIDPAPAGICGNPISFMSKGTWRASRFRKRFIREISGAEISILWISNTTSETHAVPDARPRDSDPWAFLLARFTHIGCDLYSAPHKITGERHA